MAAANEKESLKLKYARRSLGGNSSRSQENLYSPHEITAVPISSEEPAEKPEAQQPQNYYISNNRANSDSSPKLLPELEGTIAKLEQASKENIQNQMKISSLQQQLMAQERVLRESDRKIKDLAETLTEKDKVIEQMTIHRDTEEKPSDEEELQQLKEMFVGQDCSLSQFRAALLSMKEEVYRLSDALQEERAQVAAKTKEVCSLRKDLEDEKKVECELERSLSAEANKNKKLQEELKYLVEGVNREKQDLKNGFEEFRDATIQFLKNCQEHRSVLLQTVKESKPMP